MQALYNSGKLSSIEDVNVDIDGLSLQLYSALFQCVLPVDQRSISKPSSNNNSLGKYVSLIPKAAQIKAECCSVMLEHSDRE